jgi:hypothetical protein
MRTQAAIERDVRNHLLCDEDATLNDGETGRLYREAHNMEPGEPLDSDPVELWANEIAQRE